MRVWAASPARAGRRRRAGGGRAWASVLVVALVLAEASALRADEVDDRVAGLLRARAGTLFEREKLGEARARAELSLELKGDARTQLLLARILLAQGDCAAALPILRALELGSFPRRARDTAERRILEARIACGDIRGKLGAVEGMIRLAGGSFLMGDADRGELDERPPHRVSLGPFWLERTEVTVDAYGRCVETGDCPRRFFRSAREMRYCNFEEPGRQAHPMNCVDFRGAVAYCRWRGWRLPTEAEWEFAARGASGRTYPWGEERPTCARVVMKDDVNDGCGQDRTFPVGSKPLGATPEGLLDMAGNVWEWVADWYEPSYYASSPAKGPAGPSIGLVRGMRGGSWLSPDAAGLRGADRDSEKADYVGNGVGLRCARDEP